MSTRQAPGSSTVFAASINSRKRTTSEVSGTMEDSRSLKKPKRDDGSKDKKKRSRKRRRKSSVVTTVEPDIHAQPRSRSITVATQETSQEEVDGTPENMLDEEAQPPQDLNHAGDVEDTSPRIPYADKGKGKAKQESFSESPESQIARLQQEFETQRLLLEQHKCHLAQVHQALTCQICLDLLHKPFALAPCGHIVCYTCLFRWFTASEAPGAHHSLQEEISGPPETSHCHKKKKCPICRTHIFERPIEVWGVKSMVTGLVRSGLVELPAPAPAPELEASTSANDDPWRNIFHRTNRGLLFDVFEPRPPRPPRPGGEGLGEMGMYDADDGGIYRCIDCMHEIWRGVCTHCHREYPGHRASEDDEDDDDLEFDADGDYREILEMFANAQTALLGEDGAHSDSDSEASAGPTFEEVIDDEDDDEDVEHDLVEIYRNHNPAHSNASRTLGRLYRNPFDELFPAGHSEEGGIGHIVEVRDDESGDDSDDYEGSFIDDSDAPPAAPSLETSPRSDSPRGYFRRRRGHVNIIDHDDLDDLDDEVVVTEGPAGSNRGSVRDTIIGSDDDEVLSDLPPNRTRGSRRTIVELTDDSEEDRLTDENDDDDDDDEGGDQRTYEDDGSRLGPSSRLMRLMQEPDIDGDEDEDEDEGW